MLPYDHNVILTYLLGFWRWRCIVHHAHKVLMALEEVIG